MEIGWTHTVEFAAQAQSVSSARLFVRDRLREHGCAHIAGDVQLVVSELATNAVTHARTSFVVTLRCDDHDVVLTVRDESPLLPAVVKAELLAVRGRGLSIVEAVSRECGSSEHPGLAKSVWASFALPRSS